MLSSKHVVAPPSPPDVATVIRDVLASLPVEHEQVDASTFVVVLPGERKLKTTVLLVVGAHSVTINAFVVRRPDENLEEVYRWLLQQNAKHPGLAFGIDALGDVYLVALLALDAVTADAIDAMLGRVLQAADDSFNLLLELGFASSIRREWAWRVSRGESLANLAAFAHLVDDGTGHGASG
jgi:hypothetical protein